jgi:hypothetical protein
MKTKKMYVGLAALALFMVAGVASVKSNLNY